MIAIFYGVHKNGMIARKLIALNATLITLVTKERRRVRNETIFRTPRTLVRSILALLFRLWFG